uniref:ATP synthase F0 subunit 8 n=1 Tax=Nihonogomphus semanticus TaxID=1904532 RepID=UPI0023F21E4A|nr:ATP synthase F0 subunit 8 [Nihonogomphus semanticus]WDY83471.1 ATP synthase F0 subunit 8 [Nihonogomphus semanticus]
MPQMAPMSWLLLFLFFTLSMILFNMMNYYLYSPKIQSSTEDNIKKTESKNWKW